MDFLLEIIKYFGVSSIPIIIGIVISSYLLYRLAERRSKPGTEITVLWGLLRYVKEDGKQFIPPPPFDSNPHPEQIDLIKDITEDSVELLKNGGSTSGGLWLSAMSITTPTDLLLSTSTQIKPEHRAEALAHLSLTLTAFNKLKESREIAEHSLSTALNIRDGLSSDKYTKLAEKFLDARLPMFAQKAIKQAYDKSLASRHPENYRHLIQIYVQAFTPEKALAISRTLPDPKSKTEALEAIITYYTEKNMDKEAAQSIKEAVNIIQQMQKPNDRAHAYAERAREWMKIRKYDEAANIARLAKSEANKINPQELFGELTIKTITNDMNFLENPPLAVLRIAETQQNPYILTHLFRFLPKNGDETIQIAKSAATIASQKHLPDALADAAQMLNAAGLCDAAQKAAQDAMSMAMNAADRKFRDTPLQKTAEILALNGNFEEAITATSGISSPKHGCEAMLRVLIAAYAHTGSISSKAATDIIRLRTSITTLNDKDRSAATMQLAVSMALLRNLQEAYQFAKHAPFSEHKLIAFAAILFAYNLMNLPVVETTKIHKTHGEVLKKILLPILDWNLVV